MSVTIGLYNYLLTMELGMEDCGWAGADLTRLLEMRLNVMTRRMNRFVDLRDEGAALT